MMKQRIKRVLKRLYRGYQIGICIRNGNKCIRKTGNPVPALRRESRAEIRSYWRQYGIRAPLCWHRILYAATGLETPAFVPESVFVVDILPRIRNSGLAAGWGDKSYLDYHIRGAEMVKCVLRNVSGRYLDKDFCLITAEEAQQILNASAETLVVKPALDTNTGKGVRLLSAPYDLPALEREYKKNFVLQLPLHQHAEMAKLNPTSVNTIRINSVLIGTRAHIMSAFVKVGEAGQFADNSGKNRFFIGIDENGRYNDYAIDHDLRKYDRIPSGYCFAGQSVPFFKEACTAIEKAHKSLPHFQMVFWDVCISEDGTAVIVEANLRRPDVTIGQAATGRPFFGKYSEELYRSIFAQ